MLMSLHNILQAYDANYILRVSVHWVLAINFVTRFIFSDSPHDRFFFLLLLWHSHLSQLDHFHIVVMRILTMRVSMVISVIVIMAMYFILLFARLFIIVRMSAATIGLNFTIRRLLFLRTVLTALTLLIFRVLTQPR